MQYRHLGTLRKTGGSALPNAAAQILEKAAREKTAAAGVLRLPWCPEQSKDRGANAITWSTLAGLWKASWWCRFPTRLMKHLPMKTRWCQQRQAGAEP